MIIGYARTSTFDQQAGFEAQKKKLLDAGCEKIYSEQVSAVQERQVLSVALDFIREGDVFIVTSIDRLARSIRDLMVILDAIEKKKVVLKILDLGLDTSTPTGRLIIGVLGSVAQFEREIMLERQREGIAKAKALGKYRGRKPTAMEKKDEVLSLLHSGMKKAEIARQLGISVMSVYRIIGKQIVK